MDLPNNPPYTFIRGDRMVEAPTDRKVGQDRVRWGPEGPMAQGWQFDAVLPRLVDEAEASIARRAAAGGPFFLYFALTSPHEPIAPSARFRGKSGISDVADFIMETDDAVGRVMTALQQHGLADNTLLIFTADNGHCGYTGIAPLQDVGHRVGGPYRGYKCDISEGGHRVPLVVRWPGTVSPGSQSAQLVCLTDWMATCAEMLGVALPADAGEDSVSLLPLLRGGDAPCGRTWWFIHTAPMSCRSGRDPGNCRCAPATASKDGGAANKVCLRTYLIAKQCKRAGRRSNYIILSTTLARRAICRPNTPTLWRICSNASTSTSRKAGAHRAYLRKTT